MLSLVNVSKAYDLKPVLVDVTYTLTPGLEYALAAPNGSGKTTLLEVMAGLARPTQGTVTWSGKALGTQARRHIGVVLQQPFLYGDLTGRENLELFAALYGCRRVRELVTDWLKQVNLVHAGNTPVRTYSKGMRQRLSLVRALLHAPQVLLLDEPFDGLDTQSTAWFVDLLNGFKANGGTVFLVTHDPALHRAADRRLTLRFGRLLEVESEV